MKSKPRIMRGNATFNAFAYLLNGAHSLAQTAKEHGPGANYCRVAAVVFSAFAAEAYLNHIGVLICPTWEEAEEKRPWREKLEFIAHLLGVTPDWGRRPFQTAGRVFSFRNSLAHGRTKTQEKSYKYR